MLTVLSLALCAAPAVAPPQEVQIAVLRSGQRVETLGARPGDRFVDTPFGTFFAPADPVVEVVDGGAQLENLQRLHEEGVLTAEAWLQDLSTAGQLTELAEQARQLLRDEPDLVFPYEILERWGRRIDPVPERLPRDRRVSWLWKRVQRDDLITAVMTGARLMDEVSESFIARSEQTVSIAELREALRSPRGFHRRVAAHVAGVQQELVLRELLLPRSLLDDSEPARDGAAWGVHHMYPHSARQYWMRNLFRGEGDNRSFAAYNLGRYGGEDGLHALMHVLAAYDRRPPERFDFAGRKIAVLSDHGEDLHVLGEHDLFRARNRTLPNPADSVLELGSVLEVTRYGDSMLETILESLDLWAGEKTDRSREQWLAWYLDYVDAEES